MVHRCRLGRLLMVWAAAILSVPAIGADPATNPGTEPLVCIPPVPFGRWLEADLTHDQILGKLEWAESLVAALPGEDQVACLKHLADVHRDIGSGRAEELYQRALALAPENPELLEAIARYYRNHRGVKGLFAEAESYYVRAEAALDALLSAATEPSSWLLELRERIVRGRIELVKREGLGLVMPHRPGRLFGLYLSHSSDEGLSAVAHNDLATPALTLLRSGDFDLREMVREQDLKRRRSRLRLRYGTRPYWDVAWSSIEATEVIASQFLPVDFADLEIEEVELAVEDTLALTEEIDLLWRAGLRHGRLDLEGPARESFDRATVSATLTGSVGRVKTDLEVLTSFASVDLEPGGTDRDRLAAINLRCLRFRSPKAGGRWLIDPRGTEFTAGFVTRTRQFGEEVELVQETFFIGLEFSEFAARSDLQILSNYFRNTVRGRVGEDSSDLEVNVIAVHRLIDLVNDLRIRQGDHPFGLAQWSLTGRLFHDEPLGDLETFESQGWVIGSFVEIFSGPAHFSTIILEATYESREYRHLDERQELARFGLRLGF